ncbi:hypothetical protein [Bradyrhizobium liaoningense]|uniref:hypothetical protein n=1 Tax=Bradyrhizobium liaoningense TaxID=43992 RepID=UPI001BA7B34C|nr:hypothetical protein [Bradyrhizobium liaoningense]MBR0858980.1 hypothetical protein [Bradyrhizobium liaoningense]
MQMAVFSQVALKRDEIGMNHHRALGYCSRMIFSENRFALFRIMLKRMRRADRHPSAG